MSSNIKIVTDNRKASFDYFLEDSYEAGIVLKGTEIKSIRKGSCNIKDSYIVIKNGEAFILNMHISKYDEGNIFNHEPLRTRKLLLHKKEINKLIGVVKNEGITLIPTKVYLLNGLISVGLLTFSMYFIEPFYITDISTIPLIYLLVYFFIFLVRYKIASWATP